MKKSFLVGLLFSIISYADIFAQSYDEARLETLTNEFIQRAESSDALSLMTNIKSYYSSLSIDDKRKMLSYVTNKTSALLENEKKDEVLSVIFIYQNLTDIKDERLPTLLYIKGNIYAEKLDSIRLKNTIDELGNEIYKAHNKTSVYLTELRNNLEKVRSYIPAYKKLNGIWISDDLSWNTSNKRHVIATGFSKCGPDIYLNIDYDSFADTLSMKIDKLSDLSIQVAGKGKAIVKIKDYYSQLVIPYKSDSIYILWSSEKINLNGTEIAPLIRGSLSATSAAINAELSQKNKYSFSEQLWKGMATTAIEIGINSILDVLFTPSKKMFVLEAHLKIVNDYLMTGDLIYKRSKIDAEGTNLNYDEYRTRVNLARWLPESGVAFYGWIQGTSGPGPLVHPSLNIKQKVYKKNENTRYSYWKRNVPKTSAWAYLGYNKDQQKWLMLYNDSVLKSIGFKGDYSVKPGAQPFIGFAYSDFAEKDGVLVTEVDKTSPALMAGLKRKDIILSADDIEISNSKDMEFILKEKKIGDYIKLKVLRGKKILNLLLRVTWN